MNTKAGHYNKAIDIFVTGSVVIIGITIKRRNWHCSFIFSKDTSFLFVYFTFLGQWKKASSLALCFLGSRIQPLAN